MLILIADDDRLARYALKSLLRDLDNQNFIIAEATNGKTLVEQCSRLQPDIAFVDIDMPHLDGLSAIASCKEISPYTQFVVASGYTEFCYAQKSISLQVADYIVKPVERAQLEALLEKLSRQLSQTRSRLNMNFQFNVTQRLQLWDEIGYTAMEDPCAEMNGIYHAFSFLLDTSPTSEAYAQAYLELTQSLNQIGRRCEKERIPWFLWSSKGDGLHLILFGERELPAAFRKSLEQLCVTAPDRSICCFYCCATDLWGLYQKMEENAQLSYYRFALPAERIIRTEQYTFGEKEQALLKAAVELIAAFQDANETQYEHALTAFCSGSWKGVSGPRMAQLLSICLNGSFLWSDPRHLYDALKKHKSCLYMNPGLMRSDKITYVLDYVKKYYMQDISAAQIAEKLNMTPNYFSRFFHEGTGQTFSAYLSLLRVNQAKRILSTRLDIPVKDIALMVGYFSSRHFSKVFKNITGCSPSEFREQNSHTV